MINPGTYKAKIQDYGLVQNKSGQPQVKVFFKFKESGETFSWFGGLSTPQQQEITTKTLITLGASPNNIDKIENGLTSNVLDTTKEFDLVVAHDEYQGKTYARIKYINDPAAAKTQTYLKGTGALAGLKGTATSLIARGEVAAPTNSAPKADAGF